MNKGTLLVLSGSSGVGKGTIIAQVLEKRPELYLSVSCTTRAPQTGGGGWGKLLLHQPGSVSNAD